jgi:flagellar assembly factor FliW
MAENPKEELHLEIYTISGQLVLEKQLPAFEKEHRLNIQDLPSGVYLVKLVSDSQVVYSSKIIKE